jgi:hypothetical protein
MDEPSPTSKKFIEDKKPTASMASSDMSPSEHNPYRRLDKLKEEIEKKSYALLFFIIAGTLVSIFSTVTLTYFGTVYNSFPWGGDLGLLDYFSFYQILYFLLAAIYRVWRNKVFSNIIIILGLINIGALLYLDGMVLNHIIKAYSGELDASLVSLYLKIGPATFGFTIFYIMFFSSALTMIWSHYAAIEKKEETEIEIKIANEKLNQV